MARDPRQGDGIACRGIIGVSYTEPTIGAGLVHRTVSRWRDGEVLCAPGRGGTARTNRTEPFGAL